MSPSLTTNDAIMLTFDYAQRTVDVYSATRLEGQVIETKIFLISIFLCFSDGLNCLKDVGEVLTFTLKVTDPCVAAAITDLTNAIVPSNIPTYNLGDP